MTVPLTEMNEMKRSVPSVDRPIWLNRLLWVGFLVMFGTGIILFLNPWMSRWGATDEETTRALPGDDIVPRANTQSTRAITIHAPASAVWPWLLQLGVDRGGMYSYDWAENLVGLNVHSVDHIVPAWQHLRVGDFIRFVPEGHPVKVGPGFYVRELQPDRAMTGCFGMSDAPPSPCTSSWQFILEPLADGSTRLLLRTRTDAGSTGGQLMGALFQPLPFLMERRMLLGIRDRAERPLPGEWSRYGEPETITVPMPTAD